MAVAATPGRTGVYGTPLPPVHPHDRMLPSLKTAYCHPPPLPTDRTRPRSAGMPAPPCSPLRTRTYPSAHALCSTSTSPAVARNAATSPLRVRHGHVRPVCFDCAIAPKGTTVVARSQQQSRARRGSPSFPCIHRLARAQIRTQGCLGAVEPTPSHRVLARGARLVNDAPA